MTSGQRPFFASMQVVPRGVDRQIVEGCQRLVPLQIAANRAGAIVKSPEPNDHDAGRGSYCGAVACRSTAGLCPSASARHEFATYVFQNRRARDARLLDLPTCEVAWRSASTSLSTPR
jgi:hypothetical protein